jgi:WD40 repeat protein/tRNA A-37 threonylcarbamoyl transferase component Bud32
MAALDREPGADRTAYLDEACQGDAELRRRVDVLLRAHERAHEVLGPASEPAIDAPTVHATANTLPSREGSPTLTTGSESTGADATRDEAASHNRLAVDATVDQTGGVSGNGLKRGERIRYFGDYEIHQELGRGGMGIVYRARQMTLNRQVALKMIRAGILADDIELRRFQNESEAVAQLDHPGIVPVYEVGEHQGQRYFSMKLIPGGGLGGRLDAYKDDPRAAAALLAEVAWAVEHAHARGILHRDLKPANILLDGEGKPHVVDFGLAKKLEESIELTQSGAVMGTPAYMAPEQTLGRRGAVTIASDVYGLGAVLFAVLTGGAPFRGDSVIDTLQAVRERPADPPSRFNPKVPRDLEVICLKALEKDPRRRYASARELAEDLNRWLKGEPVLARPVSTSVRAWMWCRRRPAIAGLSAAIALVAVVGLVAAGTQWRAAVASARAAQLSAAEATASAARALESEKNAADRGDALARANRKLRQTGYASALQLAQREWELGNVPRVRTVLDSLRPAGGEDDLRGFEWHYIRRQCDAAALTLDLPAVANSAQERIDRVELHPGGSRALAVFSWRLLAWDLPGRKPVTLGPSTERFVIDARYSPDGKTVATLALDGKPEVGNPDWPARLELWDATTGKPLHSTALPRSTNFGRLAYRPGGRQVAALNRSGGPTIDTGHNDVVVVETNTGKVAWTALGKPINEALDYSPDGSLLVGPQSSHVLSVWDADTGKQLRTVDTQGESIRDIAFRPDGRRVAVADDTGRVKIYALPEWERQQSLRVSEQRAMRCRYSPDGTTLATMGAGVIRLWDGATGEDLFLIRGAESDIAFTPDGGRIAAQGDAGTIRFWDAREKHGATVHHAKKNRYDASFSADGRKIIDAEGTILDAATGAVVATTPLPKGQSVCRALLYPDGKHAILVVYQSDPRPAFVTTCDLVLRDLESGRDVKRLAGLPFPGYGLDGSPDGRWLALLSSHEGDETRRRKDLVVRDAMTLEPVLTQKDRTDYGRYVGFMVDSKALVVGTMDGVAVLEVPSGRVRRTYGPLPEPQSVAVSPDGRWIAAAPGASAAGTIVHIWNAATGALAHVIPQTAGEAVTSLSFSPDGRRLASAGFDAKVKLWDTETGLELLTLIGHTSWLWQTRFSPDGNRILSCGRDQTLRIWDGNPLASDTARDAGFAKE